MLSSSFTSLFEAPRPQISAFFYTLARVEPFTSRLIVSALFPMIVREAGFLEGGCF